MKRATLANVQESLGKYIKASAKQPVVILSNGEPVAYLVGVGLDSERVPVKLRDVLQRASLDYQTHGGTSHEQFWLEMAAETSRRPAARGKKRRT